MIFADKKNIHEDFSRGDLFATLFNEKTINDLQRGGIWVKMFKHSTLYESLKELPNEELDYTLRNDEFDKRYGLYSSKNPSNLILPDPVKMFNILRAYGNLDHEVFHAQGIAYLVSMLLNYIDSEEDVFYVLCRIMRDLNWRYHFIKPFRMP